MGLFYDSNQNGDDRGNVNQLGDFDNDGAPDFRDLDNDVTLPIELIQFKATKVGVYVQLDWSTATEINNDYFTVERSVDGENFEVILTEKGAGNSSTQKDYRRYDEQPRVGYNYYRLSQTDFNGEIESFNIEVVQFSGITSVENGGVLSANIFPNPTNGEQLFMEIEKPEAGIYQVEVLSSQWKLLDQYQFNIDDGTLYYEQEMIRRLNLAKGVYYLRLQVKRKTETFKFIVQ